MNSKYKYQTGQYVQVKQGDRLLVGRVLSAGRSIWHLFMLRYQIYIYDVELSFDYAEKDIVGTVARPDKAKHSSATDKLIDDLADIAKKII